MLGAWSQRIATQRLQLRGVDPQLLSPVALQDIDVSTPAGRSLLLLGMLSFFMILSLLTGGMYLAIDTTVGERERGTLEPLLATPVSREALLAGKLLATGAYMLLSMSLTTAALFVAGPDRHERSATRTSAPAPLSRSSPDVATGAPARGLMSWWAASHALRANPGLARRVRLPTLPLVFASLMISRPPAAQACPVFSQHLPSRRAARRDWTRCGWPRRSSRRCCGSRRVPSLRVSTGANQSSSESDAARCRAARCAICA